MEVVDFIPLDQMASNFILSASEFLWSSTFFFHFSLAIKFTISKTLPFTVEQNCTWQFPVTMCRDCHKSLLQIQSDVFKIKKWISQLRVHILHLNLYKATNISPCCVLVSFQIQLVCNTLTISNLKLFPMLSCMLPADSNVSYAIISCHLYIWFPYLKNTLNSTTG